MFRELVKKYESINKKAIIRLFIITTIILLSIACFQMTVYATSSGKLESDSRDVFPGDTITITLSITGSSSEKIGGVQADIKYNPEHLEYISYSGSISGWPYYTVNETFDINTIRFVAADIMTGSPITSTINAVSIIFKVRETAISETNIMVTAENIVLSDNEGTTNITVPTLTYSRIIASSSSKTYAIEGDSVWKNGEANGIKIISNGEYTSFVDIKVNGIIITEENYTVGEGENGSTVITLNPTYLASLGIQEHDVELVYDEGTVKTKFRISTDDNNESNNNQNLGDESNVDGNINTEKSNYTITISIVVIIFLVIVFILKLRKKLY